MTTAEAILETMTSENRLISGGPENIVDVINDLGFAAKRIADAITPSDAAPGHDETGGTISSLTEACMGMTAGLCRIADALNNIAQAMRDPNDLNAEIVEDEND